MNKVTRRLLYIDMAYLAETIREKKHEQFLEARHSGGYFERVWGVHPLSDISGGSSKRTHFVRFSKRQLIVEGVARGTGLPRFLLPLDFLLSQARLLRLLVRVVRKHDISIVVATDPFYGGLLALAISRLARRPYAICIYANYDDLYQATGALAMPRLLRFRWLEKRVARLVLSRADLVIGGNRNNLEYGIANGARGATAVVPVSKLAGAAHLMPPSEREGAEEVFARHDIPRGRPLMLYLGRLLALKHPDDAVRAMAQVIGRHPEAIGLIAGNGPMQPQLEQLVASLGMAGKIRFLGHVDQSDLSRIIPHCVTLSPLTGQALIECALGGSPIVAYDRDWQPEFIEDGVNGYIVPFRDHEAMARRAIQILDNQDLAARLSAAARQQALHYADRDRIFALEQASYEGVLRAA